MTKVELLAWVRSHLADTATPYLWPDAELYADIQDAEKEAVERGELLIEDTTSTYCAISIVSGTASYAANPLVFEVKKARMTGSTDPLERTSRGKLDTENPSWEDDTGTPERYFFQANNIIRVYPKPIASGTLNLVVLRHPVNPMGTSPEINARYHIPMLDWVYKLAYSKKDTETINKAKALEHEALFEQSFGPKRDYKVMNRQLEHRPEIVQYGGY